MCLGYGAIGGAAICVRCRGLVGWCSWAVCVRVARLPRVTGVCWVSCGVCPGRLVGVAGWCMYGQARGCEMSVVGWSVGGVSGGGV